MGGEGVDMDTTPALLKLEIERTEKYLETLKALKHQRQWFIDRINHLEHMIVGMCEKHHRGCMCVACEELMHGEDE